MRCGVWLFQLLLMPFASVTPLTQSDLESDPTLKIGLQYSFPEPEPQDGPGKRKYVTIELKGNTYLVYPILSL